MRPGSAFIKIPVHLVVGGMFYECSARLTLRITDFGSFKFWRLPSIFIREIMVSLRRVGTTPVGPSPLKVKVVRPQEKGAGIIAYIEYGGEMISG